MRAMTDTTHMTDMMDHSRTVSPSGRLGRLLVVAVCLVPAAAEARPRDGKIVVRPNRIVVVPPRGTALAPVPAVIPTPAAAAAVIPTPLAAVVPAPRLLAPRRVAIVPATPLVIPTAIAPAVRQVAGQVPVVPRPAPPQVIYASPPVTAPAPAPTPAPVVPAIPRTAPVPPPPPAPAPAPTPAPPSVIVHPPIEVLPNP